MSKAESFLKRHVPAGSGVKQPLPKVAAASPVQDMSGRIGGESASNGLPAWARRSIVANQQDKPVQPLGLMHQRTVPHGDIRMNSRPQAIPTTSFAKTSSIGGAVAACLIGIGALVWYVNIGEVATSEIPTRIYTARQIDELVAPRVLAILTEHGSGSGIPLTKRDVLTNRHVVEDIGEGATVKAFNEKWGRRVRKGTVNWISSKGDLAWIKLDEDIPVSPLKIADEKLQRGDKVYAYGYPKQAYRFGMEDLNVRATEGSVSAVDMPHEGLLHYEHTAAINHGNSGGPLFNDKGEVVGVNTWMFKDAHSAIYAIEIGELRKVFHSLWDKAHGQTPNYYEFKE